MLRVRDSIFPQNRTTRTRSPFSTRSTFAGISMYPSAWAIDVIAPLSLYAGTAIPSSTRTVWNSTRPIEETIRFESGSSTTFSTAGGRRAVGRSIRAGLLEEVEGDEVGDPGNP